MEEALHRREAGKVDRAAGAAGLDREQEGREDDDRRQQLRAAEGLLDRAQAERRRPAGWSSARSASTASGLGSRRTSFLLLEVVAGLGDEDVVERRVDELERARPRSRPRRAPGRRGDVGRAVLDLDQDGHAVERRQQLADPGADLARPRRRALGDLQLEVGVADLGLERLGRALGDDPAVVDDPTLSASWSASSRYWVVRKTVVPSSLSARPPPRSSCG